MKILQMLIDSDGVPSLGNTSDLEWEISGLSRLMCSHFLSFSLSSWFLSHFWFLHIYLLGISSLAFDVHDAELRESLCAGLWDS